MGFNMTIAVLDADPKDTRFVYPFQESTDRHGSREAFQLPGKMSGDSMNDSVELFCILLRFFGSKKGLFPSFPGEFDP